MHLNDIFCLLYLLLTFAVCKIPLYVCMHVYTADEGWLSMCNLYFQGYMGLGFQGPKGEKVSANF